MRNVFLLLIFILSWNSFPVFAQPDSLNGNSIPPGEDVGSEVVSEPVISSVIESVDVIEVGKNIIFDASGTTSTQEGATLTYSWQLGEGTTIQGIEAVHTFQQPGEYTIQLLVKDQDGRESIVEKKVFVYQRLILFISDKVSEKDRIYTLVERARLDRNIYLKLIDSFDNVSEFLGEELIIKKLDESLDDLTKAKTILVWTDGSVGLTALSHFIKSLEENQIDFSKKSIVFIYDGNSSSFENIAAGTFKTVRPERIVLVRSEAIWPLFETNDVNQFLSVLDQRVIDYRVIDESVLVVKPWNIISSLINFMIDHGVPSNSIKLVLMLPLIASIVAFFRQVVGLHTIDMITPAILTLSFMALDIGLALTIVLVIFLVACVVRVFTGRYRLLHFPRVALLFTLAAIVLLLLFFYAAYFSIPHILSVQIFPLLMLTCLAEKFLTIQYEQSFKSVIFSMGETVLVSLVCFYVVEWDVLKTFVLGHPEIIFFFIAFTVLLGRFTGLRLLEYIRFRNVILRDEDEV